MRKFFRNSVAVLLFTFAFLFFGVVSVNAAEKGSINNTKISFPSGGASFNSEENSYYVVYNSDKSANVKLESIKQNNGGISIAQRIYTAKVSIVTCSNYVSEDNVCYSWKVYEYSTGSKKVDPIDNLAKGLVLDLKNIEFKETKETKIYGKVLGGLNSIYGVENTYFAIVQYTGNWAGGVFGNDVYNAEVYRIVLSSSLSGININKSNTSAGVKLTITSGTPLSNVRYFATTETLTGGYDYAAKYSANNGVELLNSVSNNPVSSNGVFKCEFEITPEDGKNYYFEITDLAANKTVYDMNSDVKEDTNASVNDNDNDNVVDDTNIGTIILIVLVVILGLSIVLVIVQKIVDYRRKLY